MFTRYNLYDDLSDKWDEKKMSSDQLNGMLELMQDADPHSWLEQEAVRVTMQVFAAANHFFLVWHPFCGQH